MKLTTFYSSRYSLFLLFVVDAYIMYIFFAIFSCYQPHGFVCLVSSIEKGSLQGRRKKKYGGVKFIDVYREGSNSN